jgi:branched-chain amino acid transport system permease protein
MQILIEHIVNGLTLGAMYASVAVGLSLIFGVVGLVNFAQGDTFMIASYAFLVVYAGGAIPYPLAGIIVVILMFLFGVVFDTIVIRPVFNRPWYTQLVATLAASIILKEIARLIWGSTPKVAPTPYLRSFVEIPYVGVFSYQRIIVVVTVILSFWGLHLFLQKTKYGKAMRAVSQNREASSVVGINVRGIARLSFAMASALAGLGAVAVSPLFNIFPDMGLSLILRAFAAVVAGGLGQVAGAIYGSFLLGLAESLTTGYYTTALKDLIAMSVLVLVLIIRPQGIFGRKKAGI